MNECGPCKGEDIPEGFRDFTLSRKKIIILYESIRNKSSPISEYIHTIHSSIIPSISSTKQAVVFASIPLNHPSSRFPAPRSLPPRRRNPHNKPGNMADDEAELNKVTNDLDLDAVVYLDETWHQEGFEEGKEAGRQRGHREGRAVGYV